MVREDSEFVIAGGGLLGLAAGAALTRRGRQVTVLEQATVGHPGGGSKGSCRIFRLGYPDPEYVALARQARQLWNELERPGEAQLVTPTPHLTFGSELEEVRQAMLAAGAPCELLPAGEAARRYPGVAVPGPALSEPGSGVIDADAALRSLAAAVPDVRERTRVTGIGDDGRRVTVTTDGGSLSCRAVIVSAGPWTASLLAAATTGFPAVATQEQIAYLAPANGAVPGLPILIEHGGRGFYGLPVPGASLYKTGFHHTGLSADPDNQDLQPDPGQARDLVDSVRRHLPGLTPRPVSLERCIYDNSPDEDFVIGRIGNVVIGSGTSGHGFKFGPLLGDWLAALAIQETAQIPRRFSPRRFTQRGSGR
jgi:sarcosine oxidase